MNIVVAQVCLPTGQLIQLVNGDITEERADAMVNAANEHLQHAGGLARAIVQHGGRIIQQESDDWIRVHGPVPHESPAWTSAGSLPIKFIIHAVGPVWGSGEEDGKLSAAVHGSLRVADDLKLKSIAMPALSTGIFGFPKSLAAGIICRSIVDYFSVSRNSTLSSIRLVLYDQATVDAFINAWQELWGK